MNPLDLILVGILGVSILYRTWRGLIRGLFFFLGFVGGFLIAGRFYPVVAGWVRPWTPTPWAATVIGWILVFIAACLLILWVGRMARGSLEILHMRWVDRVAGFIFGVLQGVFLGGGLVMVLIAFLSPGSGFIRDSKLAPYVLQWTREAGRWVRGDLGGYLRRAPEGLPPEAPASPDRPRRGEMHRP